MTTARGIERIRRVLRDLERLEFHRSAFGLLPASGESDVGTAVVAELPGTRTKLSRFCTCEARRKGSCEHVERLLRLRDALLERWSHASPQAALETSLWWRLGALLHDGGATPLDRLKGAAPSGNSDYRIRNEHGNLLLHSHARQPCSSACVNASGSRPRPPLRQGSHCSSGSRS